MKKISSIIRNFVAVIFLYFAYFSVILILVSILLSLLGGSAGTIETLIMLILPALLILRQNEKKETRTKISNNRDNEDLVKQYEEDVESIILGIRNCENINDAVGCIENPSIILSKKETCFYDLAASATEDSIKIKRTRERLHSSGIVYNFRIAKGVSYRKSHVSPKYSEYTTTTKERNSVGSGNLIITSDRIYFDPKCTTAKNQSATFKSILKVVPVSNSEFVLEKKSGKPIMIELESDHADPNTDARVICEVINKIARGN